LGGGGEGVEEVIRMCLRITRNHFPEQQRVDRHWNLETVCLLRGKTGLL